MPSLWFSLIAGDDKVAKTLSRLRPHKRNTRSSIQVTPKTNRGVWSTADFQYYISKMAYEAMEPSEWAMLGASFFRDSECEVRGYLCYAICTAEKWLKVSNIRNAGREMFPRQTLFLPNLIRKGCIYNLSIHIN